MRTKKALALVMVAAIGSATLGACEGVQSAPKQTGGAVLGGVGGGIIGSQIGKGTGNTAAIIAGTLLGGLLGSEMGKSLDRADQMYMDRSTRSALETSRTGQPVSWNNPDSGNYGTITPTRTYYDQGNSPCRDFTSTVVIDGRSQPVSGTACRQPDGTWRLVQ